MSTTFKVIVTFLCILGILIVLNTQVKPQPKITYKVVEYENGCYDLKRNGKYVVRCM